MDYSTLHADELEKLEKYELGKKQISKQMGSCCFLDPPGFPSYFIQHIYTEQGNEPGTGPTAIIKRKSNT